MLVREGDQLMLVDLESSNGTYVGGLPITKRPVELGLAFTISQSSFTIEADRPRPISTKPLLGPSFTDASSSERSTLQIQTVDNEDAVSSPQRDTKESPRATDDGAVADDETPTNRRIEALEPPEPKRERSTVRLEAASDPVAASERKTAELAAVSAPARSTVELRPPPTTKAPTPAEAVPVFFPPPPAVEADVSELEYTEAKPGFGTTSAAAPKSNYDGDLLSDITEYRGFRIRLQRDEIPSGDEVAAMIDLEAKLRGPKLDDDPRRDVVALRFFKRFNYDAPVRARFTLPRHTYHLEGTIRDLSVDGLRCGLNDSMFKPQRRPLRRWSALWLEHGVVHTASRPVRGAVHRKRPRWHACAIHGDFAGGVGEERPGRLRFRRGAVVERAQRRHRRHPDGGDHAAHRAVSLPPVPDRQIAVR